MCDDLFDNVDATVVCRQIVGFSDQGTYKNSVLRIIITIHYIITGALFLSRGSLSTGIGPIFLSLLRCSGDESSLLDCRRNRNQPIGLHTCEHGQDVAVQCKGTYLEFSPRRLL